MALPRTALNHLRTIFLFSVRYPWVRCGHDVHCQVSARFWSPHKDIRIGDHVGIGHGCIFLCDTEIGSKVLIAANVAFLNSDDHRIDVIGKTIWDSGRGDKHRVVIEDDVWIGHGSIILAPCRVGRGAVVGAGSVVTKPVQPYAIVGGVPARVLKMRFSEQEILEHEGILKSS